MKLTEKDLRYYSVYGAVVATQVQDFINEGRGAPNYEIMTRFVEEAHAVAELAEEVQGGEPDEEDDVDV